VTSEPQNGPEPAEEAPTEDSASAVDPLVEAETKLATLKDQLLRTAADFDNYRKRARREIEDAQNIGREGMLKDLLPVFDNLQRATAHIDQATDLSSFTSGLQMVLKQFQEVLRRVGIERVPASGSAFDPAIHEAIQHLETDDVAPGMVAAEVQPGYRLGERLIRPAMVVVAKSKPAKEPSQAEGADENPATH
jgi:molecular chaperone GrpE